MYFVWDDRNKAHIGTHDVEPYEAEDVVRSARPPYPRRSGPEKYLVKGPTAAGRWLQVIDVLRPVETIRIEEVDPEDWVELQSGQPGVYVIHARDLAPGERR